MLLRHCRYPSSGLCEQKTPRNKQLVVGRWHRHVLSNDIVELVEKEVPKAQLRTTVRSSSWDGGMV